jgi:Protein of unknown function (DUF2637)
MTGWIRGPRWVALRLVALLVLAAAVASFAQSYRGLFLWAVHHGETGFWAACWPLMVDSFIAVGEIALFVALVDAWDRRRRAVAWTVTAVGLVISVAGNVGHAPTHDLPTRVTFAVPPLAAAGALFVGLVILKAVISGQRQALPAAVVSAREVAMARSGERAYSAALSAAARAAEADRRRREKADRQQAPKRPRRPVNGRPGRRSKEAAVAALVAAPDMTGEELTARFGGTDRTQRRWRGEARELATAASNGAGTLTETAP